MKLKTKDKIYMDQFDADEKHFKLMGILIILLFILMGLWGIVG